MVSGTEFEARGWALSKSPIDRISFRHNGTEVGSTRTGGIRWDVFRAWPDFGAFDSGYSLCWPITGSTAREHLLEATVHTKIGEAFTYIFKRGFRL